MQIYFSGFLVGGLLICALVVLLALRFLVHKRAKVDSIVMAAPFALIFSIFYIIAYGVNLFSLCIFVLVFIVFFTNYKALQRFADGLYVDYYHGYFSVTSIIEALLTIGIAICLIIYAPISDTPSKGYSVSKVVLTGSATKGLSEKTEMLQSVDAVIYEYVGENGIDEEKPILLYVPDFFCYSKDFSPVLGAYAREGYSVVAVDLYLKDVVYLSRFLDSKLLRPFSMRMQKVYNESIFNENVNTYIAKKEWEIKTIKTYLETKYPNKTIRFLGDTYTSEAAKNLFLEENIVKYNWGGCGLLEQTLPLEYKVLVSEKINN